MIINQNPAGSGSENVSGYFEEQESEIQPCREHPLRDITRLQEQPETLFHNIDTAELMREFDFDSLYPQMVVSAKPQVRQEVKRQKKSGVCVTNREQGK